MSRARNARTFALTLFVVAWLFAGGATLLAREGEAALAWFVGIHAVVLTLGACAVIAEADAVKAHTADGDAFPRTVTHHKIEITTAGDEPPEIHP